MKKQSEVTELKKMNKSNCKACAYCYIEFSDMNFICGHPDSGEFGLYLYKGVPDHCGPTRTKFEQHPNRRPNGDLKLLST